MNKEHLKFLVCTKCKNPLKVTECNKSNGQYIESGSLACTECKKTFPIIDFVPRFVPLENYSNNFGLQWLKHAKTQYDTHSGSEATDKRFFEETKWVKDLSGQYILEVGSGSGRFTAEAAKTGAMVVSMDYSRAVEANYASNGQKENVLIVQADIYNMPFLENFFDKLFCFGVLQHTPDVEQSFSSLPPFMKSGGKIVVDCYRKHKPLKQFFKTKYWVRPLTKRMKPDTLYELVRKYVKFMWPFSRQIHKLPYGKNINWALLVADYRSTWSIKVMRN